jgi:hypothetical protein
VKHDLLEKVDVIKEYFSKPAGMSMEVLKSRLQKADIKFDRKTLKNIINTFEETGCVEVDVKYMRENPVRTAEVIAQVEQIVVDANERGDSLSIHQIQRATNLTYGTVQRILHENLCYNPYHPISVQALSEDDFQSRIEFAETFAAVRSREGDSFIDRIIYSDESIFHVNGQVNRHNCVCWSPTNPQRILPVLSIGLRVMVWAGIWSGGRVGPIFINTPLNGPGYVEILEQVWPQIRRHVVNNYLYFQQDKLIIFKNLG